MKRKLYIVVNIIILIFTLANSSTAISLNKPVFYNLPVFQLNINKVNDIDFKEYLLAKSSYIKKMEFTVNDKNIIKEIKYIPETGIIRISTGKKSGIIHIPVKIKTAAEIIYQDIFVKVSQSKYKKKISYKGEKGQKVSIAGSFNGWNMNADILKEKDGIYSTTLELEPGEYTYKFVINGKKWISDPANPEQSRDGWGNSVLTVGNSVKVDYTITSRSAHKKDDDIELSFDIEIKSSKKLNSSVYFLYRNLIINQVDNFENGISACRLPLEYLKSSELSSLNEYLNRIYILVISGENNYYIKSYQLDAEKDAFNWRDAVLYFVFTDRFYNYKNTFNYKVKGKKSDRDNFHGGNFAGITKKIREGYFDRLGVNSIWISPVYENPRDKTFAGYHGYWSIDSYKIAQNFGTMDDLKEMVRTAHKHNIKILVDFVAKHVFKENPVYKEHPEYFGKLYLPDGRKNIGLFDEYPLTTWFGDYLPAFNFHNPDALKFQVDNALWLIKQTDIDGFRLDAVKHIDHILFKKMRERIKLEVEVPYKKIFYMVGESMTSREKIMEYVNTGEITGQFDFPLYWDIRAVFGADQDNFKRLNKGLLDSLKDYGSESIMSTILGNHDFSRFMAYADNEFKPDSVNEQEYGYKHNVKVDDPANYRKLKLGFTFLMTIPGVPLIYYGDEFGMTGAHDPDNRRDMRFGKDLTEPEKGVLNYVQKITNIRRKYKVFRYGDIIPLKVDNEIYVYALTFFNKKSVVVLTRRSDVTNISVNLPDWLKIEKLANVITGNKIKVKNNILSIDIKPYTGYVFVN